MEGFKPAVFRTDTLIRSIVLPVVSGETLAAPLGEETTYLEVLQGRS